MNLDSKQRAKILQAIKKLVLSRHINVARIDYGAWTERVDSLTPKLIPIDLAGFEAGVCELLGELKTSHTVFYHSHRKESLPQHTINASLRDVSRDGCHKWMFLDVFEDGPAYLAGIKPGDFLDTVDGTVYMPPSTPLFATGQTHRLRITNSRAEGPKEIAVDVPQRKGTKQRPPIVEPKIPIHAKIGANIGVLKIPYFPGAAGIGFAKDLDRAIEHIKEEGCERLIVDLRGNIGGSLGFARLASYMCPGKIAIGHSLTPRRLREGYTSESLPRVAMPQSQSGLLITLACFALRDKSVMLLTQGLGEQPFHGRIVILVNEWTNSAAEMVANFATENKLATVVGQKTRGNVLGAVNFGVGSGYWLRLPVFGWFTSRSRSLEGNGVDPDVLIDMSADALADGQDNQLALATDIVERL